MQYSKQLLFFPAIHMHACCVKGKWQKCDRGCEGMGELGGGVEGARLAPDGLSPCSYAYDVYKFTKSVYAYIHIIANAAP